MNPATGEVLFAKEPHLRLPPASTTKVLTALVALERLDPNARIWVSPQAASAPPSRIGLRTGEAALTQDLLYGLMLKSGNDAAETLAEAAGGSVAGFAELMNAKAWQIGARNSHFMNPHGLPNDDHYATAYDLALIFRQAMNHPMFADIVRTRNAALRIESGQGLYGDWRMVPVVNHNRLLGSYEGTLGGKTGFTLKARRCFVGEVDRGGVRLIVAILNSPHSGALWNDARKLLDYGFAHYGLASPPPEPLPIVVRREPVASPDEDDSDEPMARPAPVTRAAMMRPAARAGIKAPTPDRPRELMVVRTAPPIKPVVVTTRTQEVVRPRGVARPVAAAKSAAAKPTKPLVLAAVKPVGSPKFAKPAVVVPAKPAKSATATAKSEKRESTKVAAVRAEPPAKLQKVAMTKRRS
jgi:D-alanyl-D-alanine carboxypeptidase